MSRFLRCICRISLLCCLLFISCSVIDDFEYGDESDATLSISINARQETDINTRAGTETGQNGEYINNLCVLLIKDNIVVKKFLPDLTGNTLALAGNLKIWQSETFSLVPGDYTVYAFANINTYFNTQWGSITGIEENTDISQLGFNIDDIIIENPAEKLDFNTYFIPMSAKRTFTVKSYTKSLSIGMDRLVAKIRMQINGKIGTTVNYVSFGGYADRVTLFDEKALTDESYTPVKKITPADANNTITDNGAGVGMLYIPDFYVNASPLGHPFTVNIKTIETNAIVHDATAVTNRDELPRNSIFPLTLQLNEYGLDLQAQCWLSPIGSLPVEVAVSFLPDTYEIEVPEGCQFAFTVAGVTGGNQVTDLKGTWNIISPINGIDFDGETEGVRTVKGHVTASAGKTFDLGLLVTWKDGSASYSRNYTVILKTKDIADYPLYSKTRMLDSELDYLHQELLNIFIN